MGEQSTRTSRAWDDFGGTARSTWNTRDVRVFGDRRDPIAEPACLRCRHGEYLTRVPYESEHDGRYICGQCIDILLRKERSA